MYNLYKRVNIESELEYLIFDFFTTISNTFVECDDIEKSKELSTILLSFFNIFRNGNISEEDEVYIMNKIKMLYNNMLNESEKIKLLFKFFELADENGVRVNFRYGEMNDRFQIEKSTMLIVKYFKTIVNALLSARKNGNYKIPFRYLVCFWSSIRVFGIGDDYVDSLCFNVITKETTEELFSAVMKKAVEYGLFLSEEEVFSYE